MAPHKFLENLGAKNKNDIIFINTVDSEVEKPMAILYEKIKQTDNKNSAYKPKIIWSNIFIFIVLHSLAVYSLLFVFPFQSKGLWMFFGFLYIFLPFGVTGGAHRLWAHRSYKAKLPLKIILLICFATAGQGSVYNWVRDHRTHHKYSETDADPHNAKRGFFFAHMGWLLQKRHPEVIRKGKLIDMSDIEQDPLLAFNHKHFVAIGVLFVFILPILIPCILWNESLHDSFFTAIFRYIYALHLTWLVNSAAHFYGYKPYDKRINPSENRLVSFLDAGEGWHNYHHVFPWDYKAAELGDYKLNTTTFFLDMFAKIGWAYDLKVASKELVDRVSTKYGDGSRVHEVDENGNVMNICEVND